MRAVAAGEPRAETALYELFDKGMRYMVARQLGSENVEDVLHTAFIDVLAAVRDGKILEPERLAGFVRVIVQRKIIAEIGARSRQRVRNVGLDCYTPVDRRPSSETSLARVQEVAIAQDVLAALKPQQREVLVRFYLDGKSPNRICSEMQISDHQFRNLKHRSKSTFAERVQCALRPKGPRRSATSAGKRVQGINRTENRVSATLFPQITIKGLFARSCSEIGQRLAPKVAETQSLSNHIALGQL